MSGPVAPHSVSVRFGEPTYPAALAACPDAPKILYLSGDLPEARAVAIVGSRAATRVGCERAAATARLLSSRGCTIVSGGAIGVDAAAHRGALEVEGATVAVLGSSLDELYPPRNRALLEQIAATGALVTPFGPGHPIRRGNFPRRNRIIAGLVEAVVVVEAGARSGSLSTAAAAREYGRRVLAFVGSPGTHRLASEDARLVDNVDDVWAALEGRASLDRKWIEPRDETERRLLAALGSKPRSVDDVARALAWSPRKVAAALLALEIDGKAFRSAHGYVRTSVADCGAVG